MIPATREEAIAAIVELDVAKWGEGEREASLRLRSAECPTLGLALNKLAHYDVTNVNTAIRAAAKKAMTSDDRAYLRRGG